MKNKHKKYWAIITISLLGCQTSEDTFFDYYKIYTALPPASSQIASPYKSQEFHAYINERNEIYGTGNAHRFYTTDFFQTIQMKSGFGKFGDYYTDGKNVATSYEGDDDLVIAESSNYGFEFTERFSIPYADTEDVAIFHLNSSMGWMVMPGGSGAVIYQIIGDIYTKLSTVKTDMYTDPISIYFENELEGCMLIGDNFVAKTKFYKTSDGGKTWTQPSVLTLEKDSGSTPHVINMVRSFGQLVVAYPDEEGRNAYYNHIYISRNGGLTWEFISDDNHKACYQFLSEQTGYALEVTRYVHNYEDDLPASLGYLQKTSDGGETWQRVSNQVLYADNIFFANEMVGIATSYSYMQVTLDGGVTWHLLVYPLEKGS